MKISFVHNKQICIENHIIISYSIHMKEKEKDDTKHKNNFL